MIRFLLLAGLGVLIALPIFISGGYVHLATSTIILCLLALSLNMLVGYSGMVSLGHAAYFTLGAYGAALLIDKCHWPTFLAFIGGPIIGGLGAFGTALICVKRRGGYFVMLTLALSMVLYAVLYQWYGLTGGETGITNIWPPPIISSRIRYYYFSLGFVVLASTAIYIMIKSPFGYIMRAIRENTDQAESIGINTHKCRVIIFTVAGFFAGIAGTLYAFHCGAVFPSYSFWLVSASCLVACILGGMHYFIGPVLGTWAMEILKSIVSMHISWWQICLGSVTLFVVIYLPKGLVGLFEKRGKR
ncbi:MAG: branched-chain amino acid ABC transporter permease [Deltaproteobacteria bacterium]